MAWAGGLILGGINAASAIGLKEQRLDAEGELEKSQLPQYKKNQSIIDFYDEALRKYKVSPTESAAYKVNNQNIRQGTTQGINALQDRRSALAGVPGIMQGQNNALLKASVAADQDKSRQAGIVNAAGHAASAENQRDYQYNYLAPFEKWYNLKARKAAALASKQDKAEANASSGLMSFAGSGGGGGMMGGMGGMMGGGGNPASGGGASSDKRLKHNYYVIGKSPSGINIYEFSYIGSSDRYIGVMAQDVPQASFVDDNGFFAVDYNKIDVEFKKI